MHTNKTPNYDLPLFTTLDKPTTLGDFNGAMTKIDSGIHAAQVAADNAQETATTALDNVETALVNAAEAKTNAAEAKELATQAHEDAAEAVETAGNALTLVTSLDTRVTTDEGTIASNTAAAAAAQDTATRALDKATAHETRIDALEDNTGAGSESGYDVATLGTLAARISNNATAAATAQDTATRALDKATAHETRIDALEDNTGAGSESGYDVATLGTLAARIDALENGGSGNNKRTFNNPDKTVSVVGTFSAALDKLYSEIDKDKLTPDSVIYRVYSDNGHERYTIGGIGEDSIQMHCVARYDQTAIYTLVLKSSSSSAYSSGFSASGTFNVDRSNTQVDIMFHIWY